MKKHILLVDDDIDELKIFMDVFPPSCCCKHFLADPPGPQVLISFFAVIVSDNAVEILSIRPEVYL